MNLRDRIINEISILDVYPYELTNNRGVCEKKGKNTKSPSFVYYPHTNTWSCFSCGTGGDVINLHSHINDLSYKESLFILAKELKISISPEEKKYHEKLDKIHECFRFFQKICHENFLKSSYFEEIKKRRGFSEETIKTYKIGFCNINVQRIMEEKYDKDFLLDAGFLNDKNNWYIKNRIVYPYLNFKNEPIYFIYRKIGEEPGYKYIKHHKTKYIRESIFGINSLHLRDDVVIITEGITDAISVIQCGVPCLSPVTTRFKHQDLQKIYFLVKRFKKIIVINDSEESQRGLEGAEQTLSFLLRKGLPGYINEIPRPIGVEKIDLNDYLTKDGKEKIEELINTAIDGLTYYLDRINEKSTQKEIEDLMRLIPRENIVLREDVFNAIKKRKKMTIRGIRQIYDLIVKEEEKERKKEELFSDLGEGIIEEGTTSSFEMEASDIICTFPFKNGYVQNTRNGVFFIQVSDNLEKRTLILESGLEIIHKMFYLGEELFSYRFRGKEYNTQSRTLMLSELKHFIYEGERGKDIIKKLITYMGDQLEYKEVKSILGFDDGWVLPQHQEVGNYRILVYTDLHKRAYESAEICLKEIRDEEFYDDVDKLKRFLEITEMDKRKVAIIIGWCMASVFKLPIIRYFNLFPGLMCSGVRQTGKTYFVKFFAVDFYGIWDNYFSGGSIKTEARIEDILSTSTFPIHLDELEYLKYSIIEIMKSTLTGIHNYFRKLSVVESIQKPEVAPFVITTNNPPKPFLDPALNSKMIILEYSDKETIEEKQEWNDIYNELRKAKLFTYLYDYTKDWDDEKVINILQLIERNFKLKMEHSRLRKKMLVVLFGLVLFEKIFNINLLDDLKLDLFERSERLISEDLLDKFIQFCTIAVNYDPGYENDSGGHVRGDNPKYLTAELHELEEGILVFTNVNLRDFNEFARESYNLKQLQGLLQDAVQDKEIFKYERFRIEGKQVRGIKIDMKKYEALKNEE